MARYYLDDFQYDKENRLYALHMECDDKGVPIRAITRARTDVIKLPFDLVELEKGDVVYGEGNTKYFLGDQHPNKWKNYDDNF